MLDLLLTDICVVTPDIGAMETRATVVRDAVLGVRGRRIEFVGTKASAAGVNAARVMSLPGRVVTPGFINVHTHAVLSLMRGIAIDLGFAPAYTKGVPHGHDITPDEAVALARCGALEALTFGSTSMLDSYVHADVTLPAMADLGMRVWACTRFHDVDFTTVHEGRWDYDEAIGQRCIDETLDLMKRHHGGFDGRAHVMLAPHAPDTCSDALLTKVARLQRETGLIAWTHLSQSPLENDIVMRRSGCTPTALLDRVGLLTDKLVAAHCLYLTDDDIARLGSSGMTLAHVPKGNATGGAMAPTPRLRDAGANIALATDNLTQDMTEAMRLALMVARVQNGRVTDAWQPHRALDMATSAGARLVGMSHELGALKAGYLADFVVFDFRRPHLTPLLNPLGTLIHDACGRDVEHVFVNGRQVISDGNPVQADATRIRTDAQSAAEAIWRRSAGETLARGWGA